MVNPVGPICNVILKELLISRIFVEYVHFREDTHKKVFFLVVGPLRFYPPYTNGLVVHATFFPTPLVSSLTKALPV